MFRHTQKRKGKKNNTYLTEPTSPVKDTTFSCRGTLTSTELGLVLQKPPWAKSPSLCFVFTADLPSRSFSLSHRASLASLKSSFLSSCTPPLSSLAWFALWGNKFHSDLGLHHGLLSSAYPQCARACVCGAKEICVRDLLSWVVSGQSVCTGWSLQTTQPSIDRQPLICKIQWLTSGSVWSPQTE